jgi:acyl-ACP thioesterase
MIELVPIPEQGRRFVAARRVRWGDADARGRLRLDAIARYLQDISNDDTRDVGHDPSAPWIVRRTSIAVDRPLRAGEAVTLTSFCGGIGSRWAERRTSMTGEHGGRVEAASLWVFIDPATGRPARLQQTFLDAYAEAAAGRSVEARLAHGPVPAPGDGHRRPWPLRTTDLDGLGHVNNAATWEAVEDELTRLGLRPVTAELEYRDAIELDDAVEVVSAALDAADLPPHATGRIGVWLTVGGTVRAAADVATRPPKSPK